MCWLRSWLRLAGAETPRKTAIHAKNSVFGEGKNTRRRAPATQGHTRILLSSSSFLILVLVLFLFLLSPPGDAAGG
jgi:hypothetical protein